MLEFIRFWSKGSPKNLGLDAFPDPVSHFGFPWCSFLVLNFLGIASCEGVPALPLSGIFSGLVFLLCKIFFNTDLIC